MKQIFFLFVSLLLTFSGFSQSKTYVILGGEMIFSFAAIKDPGNSQSSTIRLMPNP